MEEAVARLEIPRIDGIQLVIGDVNSEMAVCTSSLLPPARGCCQYGSTRAPYRYRGSCLSRESVRINATTKQAFFAHAQGPRSLMQRMRRLGLLPAWPIEHRLRSCARQISSTVLQDRGQSRPWPVARKSVPSATVSGPQVWRRGKKRSQSISISELPQGVITSELPELPELPKDEPAYPTVVQQARKNMNTFEHCVLLTRVGNFYEVSTLLRGIDRERCRLMIGCT